MPNPSTVESDNQPTSVDSLGEALATIGKSRLVIIHDTDADGTCAAWCIWKGFKDDYDDVLLIPQRAGANEIPSGITENDSVFLVDRSYPVPMLITLSEFVTDVTVIDHHKSFMDSVIESDFTFTGMYTTATSIHSTLDNLSITVDTTHSACMLAHMYVMEHGIDPDTSVNPPWFVSYIEDRDLWKWKLPNSREINAGLSHYGHTFENYNNLLAAYALQEGTPEYDQEMIKNQGMVCITTRLKIIRNIAHGPTVFYRVILCDLGDFSPQYISVNVVCCPFDLISDLGDYMFNYVTELDSPPNSRLKRPDVVMVYNYDFEKDQYSYSLRSKVNVLNIAKQFGGGGHPNACGFSTPTTMHPLAVLDHLAK